MAKLLAIYIRINMNQQKTIAIVAIAALMILGFAYATPSMHNDHLALAKKTTGSKTKCDTEDETGVKKEESTSKEETGCSSTSSPPLGH